MRRQKAIREDHQKSLKNAKVLPARVVKKLELLGYKRGTPKFHTLDEPYQGSQPTAEPGPAGQWGRGEKNTSIV